MVQRLVMVFLMVLGWQAESRAGHEVRQCTKSLIPEWIHELNGSKNQAPAFHCPDWIVKKKSLPACPKTGTHATLPETNPKAFVVIGPTAHLDSVFELVTNTLKHSPDQLPVFLGSFGYEYEDLLKKLKKAHPKIDWKNQVVSTYLGPYSDETFYIRDPFHSRVDSKGKIEVFHTKRVPGISEQFSKILKECGMAAESVEGKIKNEGEFSQTTLGGNFLTILPGVHVSTELTPVHEQSGWTEDNTIVFDSYTNVNHIDEIIQPVQTTFDEKGCPKVSILAVNSAKSVDLIREAALKNPTGQAFDLSFNGAIQQEDFSREWDKFENSRHLNSITRNDMSRWLGRGIGPGKNGQKAAINGFPQICTYFESLPDLPGLEINLEENQDVSFTFGQKPSKVMVIDSDGSTPAKRQTKSLAKGYTKAEYEELNTECHRHPYCMITKTPNPPAAKKDCSSLTYSDLYKVLKHTDYNRAVASELDQSVRQLKIDVESKIAKKYPGCKQTVDWIDAPAILHKGMWALPNSVNSIPVVPGTVGMTDPYIKPFQEHYLAEMTKRNIEVTWFDTLGLNNFAGETKTGNLHCTTNAIPICDPGK